MRKMKRKLTGFFILSALILSAIVASRVINVIYTPVEIDHIMCEIKPGSTGRDIAETLYKNNIITDKEIFHIIIRLKKLDRTLKAGQYLFSGNLTMFDTIEKLLSGEIIVMRVTIPEGYSIYRTFKTIVDNEIGDYERFLRLANDKAFITDATGFEVPSLEGFLYPDTYIFGADMSEESIIRTMISNFYTRLSQAHITIDDFQKFYDDLILASIVELEAIFDDEKPGIAAVYQNRLNIGMPLQACPTATYHLEPQFITRRVLTYSMTRAQTPYNTYVISGLPPHPICSPAISTIFAVQNSEPSKYYYFFADRKGRHIFSSNYEDHLRKQREIN